MSKCPRLRNLLHVSTVENPSDDEADNIETTHMCFIGDDQSDEDSTTDEDEASSDLLSDQLGLLGKLASSDLNLKSKFLDESFTLNDDYYKPKRKRRMSKKSKKQAKVISDSSNSCDSNISDRTLSTSTKQIWRVKRTSNESTTDEDRYVDKIYKSDSFVTCNKISKYSIKQMIRISKDVSYSSSDSSSDDYVFSSTDSYGESKSLSDLKLSRLQHLHDQVDPDHQATNSFAVPAPITTVHSSTFEKDASSRAQADEPIVLSS
ncbi:hypothetical protein L6452_34090 [Arctium lappa]|uniref:Uncharacterized protein n=1 Tax=Arctium lappa TaxID=4217 RepID=A0ACB8YHU8_ARCLA|nr:hypothetical protein L6452_34090 [Arctium lappa]